MKTNLEILIEWQQANRLDNIRKGYDLPSLEQNLAAQRQIEQHKSAIFEDGSRDISGYQQQMQQDGNTGMIGDGLEVLAEGAGAALGFMAKATGLPGQAIASGEPGGEGE